MTEYDVAIVGGGILGLATAYALSVRHDGLGLAVLEKELQVAAHQSGRNSGVIHSGLYYRPGSLKAEMCVRGADRMVEFCADNGVPYQRQGKVVVATSSSEVPALDELHRRGQANGLRGLKRIGPAELSELEPHAQGLAALHVPTAGAVDFGSVCGALANLLTRRGVDVRTAFPVERIQVSHEAVAISGRAGSVRTGAMVNCAGLYADRIARLAGLEPPVRIIPFRGEYYEITGASADLVRASIYPVPDARLPFLGVHLTRSAAGSVYAGPNAVLATSREGYRWGSVRARELAWTVSYPGFWRLAGRHWRSGLAEVRRSLSRRLFAESVRALVPAVEESDLHRSSSGVRAQAVTRAGDLHDDFVIVPGPRSIHVVNAPSPGATAALAIGEHVAAQVAQALGL